MADMDRRNVLGLGLAGAAAAGALAAGSKAEAKARPAAPAIRKGLPDVVVIGAGAFGSWTALELRERGHKVTLVDLYGPGNVQGSSGGESRNIRASYGDREIYTRWATRASTLWNQRQEEFGRKLIWQNGSVRVLKPGHLEAQKVIFDKLGLPYEVLSGPETNRRFPQLHFREDETVFYEKNAGSVKAREASIAVAEALEHKGGKVEVGLATPGKVAGGKLETIKLNGGELAAGQFVFACGPWLPKVFPALLGDRIKSPRVELIFVGPAPGDRRYSWEQCPNISDLEVATSVDFGGGFKFMPELPGYVADPDLQERLPTPILVHWCREYISRRLPGLVGMPVVQTHICQLEMTDNAHFLIDQHPEMSNTWIAGGGSGHGFKHGPAVGEYVADRVMGKPAPDDQKFFTLASHGPVQGSGIG